MIVIRPEKPEDIADISSVTRLAFESEEEVDLIAAIRNSEFFIPELSLVAKDNRKTIGHILFSPIKIITETGEVPALSLAPMAVLPEYQRQGVGSQLLKEGLKVAVRLGHTIIVVIGHPGYYPRFGFRQAREYGLEIPFEVPDDAFLALELESGALDAGSGVVEYSPPFRELM